MSDFITITYAGLSDDIAKEKEVREGTTLAAFIASQNISTSTSVVKVNRMEVGNPADHMLRQGDRVTVSTKNVKGGAKA